jgi:hypothetical protein
LFSKLDPDTVYPRSGSAFIFKARSGYRISRIRIRICFQSWIRILNIQDPDPHSFSKLDPVPHRVNADPKHCW